MKDSSVIRLGPTDAAVSGFAFSRVSDRLVYRADQDTDNVIELYVADLGYIVYLPLALRSYP